MSPTQARPSKQGGNSLHRTSCVMYSGPTESVTSVQVFNKHLYVSYQGQDIRRFHLQVSTEARVTHVCLHIAKYA